MAEDIRGLPATFASIRLWDEAAFAYADMLVCQRDADVRTELLGLHAPPMVIIRNVRFGSEAPRHPDPANTGKIDWIIPL